MQQRLLALSIECVELRAEGSAFYAQAKERRAEYDALRTQYNALVRGTRD